MIWNSKRRAKIKELQKSVEAAQEQLSSQRKEVSSVASWLERRKDQNGFGADFEYTLRPRRAQ